MSFQFCQIQGLFDFSCFIFALVIVLTPHLYRGYIYVPLGGDLCYYLGSRFYHPQLGKFMNADKHTDTGTGVVGTNMFAYCNNNPVMLSDTTGENPAVKEKEDHQPLGFLGIFVAIFALVIAMQTWMNPPQVQVPDISISKPDAQAKADTEIKNKVKKQSNESYWKADLKQDSYGNYYVQIGSKISYSQAVSRVKSGKSVFTNYRKYAYKVATACSNKNSVNYEIHNEYKYSYYHYHPNPRIGKSHIWFLFF